MTTYIINITNWEQSENKFISLKKPKFPILYTTDFHLLDLTRPWYVMSEWYVCVFCRLQFYLNLLLNTNTVVSRSKSLKIYNIFDTFIYIQNPWNSKLYAKYQIKIINSISYLYYGTCLTLYCYACSFPITARNQLMFNWFQPD